MTTRLRYQVKGTIQGVGFRPFVYRLAHGLGLSGWVRNTPWGVALEIEGPRVALEGFADRFKVAAPDAARIDSISVDDISPLGSKGFTIMSSITGDIPEAQVTPDLAICSDCLREMRDSGDRRFGYPFINCTNCGPRFTIIRDLPYDRARTTMDSFIMCDACSREYDDPLERRFHAQPNACAHCGPQIALADRKGEVLCHGRDALEKARELLFGEAILAVKGLGGYHLSCLAGREEAVSELRRRKYRYDKPFAVMVRDLEAANAVCRMNEYETKLLAGPEAPIVLAAKKEGAPVAESVAPNNGYIGVMLPYTPLHHLLLEEPLDMLVMTSGNISDEPIVYRDEDAATLLGGIADYILMHNRPIYRRCDDSVTRVFRGKEYILRRSRGYTPAPLFLQKELVPLLACGAEQKNTLALTRGNAVVLSHHIGDLENYSTLASFEEGIDYFSKLLAVKPQIVVHDLHPDYLSTQYAIKCGLPRVAVQHHHAHAASCMADNDLEEKVIAVTFDGTGLGDDGNLWGGEFLICDFTGYHRAAHIAYTPMPGGAKAVKEPWRIAASYLEETFGVEWQSMELPLNKDVDYEAWQVLQQSMAQGLNAPLTSSVGRLFDGVAALLGIRSTVNYEGQAAVELEQKAQEYSAAGVFDSNKVVGAFVIYNDCIKEKEGILEINPSFIIRSIVEDIRAGRPQEEIAYRFHDMMAKIITRVCILLREKYGDYPVCLTGGVFQNMLLLEMAMAGLEAMSFRVYTHQRVPANDGGISLGQAVIGHERRDEACV